MEKENQQIRDIAENKKNDFEWGIVFDTLEHPIFVLDADNIVLEANKAAIKLFRVNSKKEIIGKKCCEKFSNFASIPEFCPGKTVETYSKTVECEVNNQTYIFSCTPIYDKSNKLRKTIHIVTNISHLKYIEENLLENEEKLSLLIANIPGVAYSCLFDRQWSMKFLSEEFKNLTGYDIADIINNKNKSYSDIIHIDDQEKVWTTISESIAKQESFLLEYRIVTKDNAIKYVWEKGKLVLRNKEHYIEGVIFDITERKEAEINLKNSEEKYRLLVENQNEVILKFNRHGNFTYLSKTFYKIFARSENDKFADRNFMEFILKEDQERILDFVSSLKNLPHSGYVEHKILTNKGWRWYGWSCKAIVDDTINEVIAVGRDVTERKIVEQELKKETEKIEEKEVNRTIFITNIIHEINPLVNNLVKYSELLNSDDISEKEREGFNKLINSSAKQVSNIFNKFIEINQLETSNAKLEKEYFSISDVIDELAICYRPLAETKNLEFVVLKPAQKDIKLYTDKQKLMQILNNLISNAIKFTSFGNVKLGYRLEENKIKIFVADTGIGIESTNHKMIFERFTQIKSEDQKFEGSGLGLSIVKELCDLLETEIFVNSSLRHGSEFSFYLDYASSDNELLNEPVPQSDHDLSELNILITEDDRINYLLLKTILNKAGATTLEAQTGNEAIEHVKTFDDKIDVILMDINLPGLSGSDALVEIKKINNKIPVIACTAYTQNEDAQKLLNQGFDDYIAKPINRNELLNIIKRNVVG
ncbi:MAG TPA: response regulator [Bacteroidales bacterium]|nr:response regulator [Bacteroidales bacterium]HOR60371.1 response regulator [Bacteroidales bacterium]HPL04687.1 response regulator [Bacteroidales bacterium]